MRSIGSSKKLRGKAMNINQHRKSIPKMVEDLIQESDIILEVLDSRFIDKMRNLEIEDYIKKSKKKLIYLFNKSDLVDRKKLQLSKELHNLKPHTFLSSKKREGSSNLRKLIKMESKKLKKEVINVGVIGYPNSGKSSLINLMVGKSVTKSSPEAGYTKGIKKIRISEGLYLIDTPGVIPVSEKVRDSGEKKVKHSEIGAITWDKVKDPDRVVAKIMKEYPQLVEEHYGIYAEGDSETLMEELGRKLNYLGKGNIVDEFRTAKKILKDWQEGVIKIA